MGALRTSRLARQTSSALRPQIAELSQQETAAADRQIDAPEAIRSIQICRSAATGSLARAKFKQHNGELASSVLPAREASPK